MKKTGGHWVTINGVHVFINDATGRITKGPKKLIGYTKDKSAKKHTGRSSTKPSSKSATSKKTPSKAEMRAIESMKEHEYAMVKAQGLDPVAYVKNRDKQVKQKAAAAKKASSAKKNTTTSGIQYYNPYKQFSSKNSSSSSKSQGKPKFFDSKNYKQAYTEAQLNRYYTPWEKLSTPKKSTKTSNTFKNKK